MTSQSFVTSPPAAEGNALSEPRVLIGDGDLIVPSQAASTTIPVPDPDVQSPDQLWDRRLDRW